MYTFGDSLQVHITMTLCTLCNTQIVTNDGITEMISIGGGRQHQSFNKMAAFTKFENLVQINQMQCVNVLHVR